MSILEFEKQQGLGPEYELIMDEMYNARDNSSILSQEPSSIFLVKTFQ